MTKAKINSIYGLCKHQEFKNEFLWLMLYDSAVDRDVNRMNIWLTEYAILNPLT